MAEELIENADCGVSFLTEFWQEKYLQEYIKNGGSKIKFVTGRQGSGKTHFLGLMTAAAKRRITRPPGSQQRRSGSMILRIFMWRFSGSVTSWGVWRRSAIS